MKKLFELLGTVLVGRYWSLTKMEIASKLKSGGGMKSLIVTGGGAGLGRTIAEQASSVGYRVGILDVNEELAIKTSSSIENSVPLVASVTSYDEISDALATFGESPDVWINNAGVVRFAPLLDLSIADWKSVVDVNLTGTFLCSSLAAKAMIDKGGGSIVNITSINGISAGTNSGAYGSTKSAISLLTQQMSLEWGKEGIRVNAISPGFIDAGMSADHYVDPVEREKREGMVPIQKIGEAQDIANVVMFLLSEESSYIHGENIVVDGGVMNSVLANIGRN